MFESYFKFIRRDSTSLHSSSLEDLHLEDLPASGGLCATDGFGSEHALCEQELEVSLTAQGTENERGGQFRMSTRSSLNFAYHEGLNTKKFRKKSRNLMLKG
jgi:hypothetical protein